jgi:signal transduction histidine kinase
MVTNLMRNAVKYMSDSAVKRITVRVVPRKNAVRIEVEDTGPGVPDGLQTKIFEPYVRAEGVTQPGLGLGLATVKRFCEAHGGDVGVRSQPGQGSVFWFTLPKTQASSQSGLVRRVG